MTETTSERKRSSYFKTLVAKVEPVPAQAPEAVPAPEPEKIEKENKRPTLSAVKGLDLSPDVKEPRRVGRMTHLLPEVDAFVTRLSASSKLSRSRVIEKALLKIMNDYK